MAVWLRSEYLKWPSGDVPPCFDILCVYLEKDRPATLAHIAGAFDQGEASKPC
jgi:hypothetical protein